jgi:hypothetical protein
MVVASEGQLMLARRPANPADEAHGRPAPAGLDETICAAACSRGRKILHAMKSSLVFLFSAAALGAVTVASGYTPDAGDFAAIFLAAALAGWVFQEYSREVRPLLVARPIRLPAPLPARHAATVPAGRIAA